MMISTAVIKHDELRLDGQVIYFSYLKYQRAISRDHLTILVFDFDAAIVIIVNY